MRSRRVLVGLRLKSKSVETCGAREKRRLRTALHHQSWYATLIADVQNQKILSKWKKRRRGVLEKMAHQTLSKKPAITTPHTLNVPQEWSNKINFPNELQNTLPEKLQQNCSQKKFAQLRCTLTQLLAEQRKTVHTLLSSLPNHILISSPFRQSLLAAPDKRQETGDWRLETRD